MERLIILGLLVISSVCVAGAQDDNHDGRNELSVWGGYSPASTTAIRFLGRTPDVKFGIAALRYSRRFHVNDTVAIRYTADAVPLAVMAYPRFSGGPRDTAVAFGGSPVGFQFNFRPRKKYQPFIATSGGILYFDKSIPNTLGRRLNFTFDLGGGVEIRQAKGRAVALGYKFYHVSNAFRGRINPGFDNNVFYVGYKFFTR